MNLDVVTKSIIIGVKKRKAIHEKKCMQFMEILSTMAIKHSFCLRDCSIAEMIGKDEFNSLLIVASNIISGDNGDFAWLVRDIFNGPDSARINEINAKIESEILKLKSWELDSAPSDDVDKKFITIIKNGFQEPVDDVAAFYEFLFGLDTLSANDISRLVGMAIYYNSEYAKNNGDHNIKNIEIIHKLARFYNANGAIVDSDDELKSYLCLYESDGSDSRDNKLQNDDGFVTLMDSLLAKSFFNSDFREFPDTKIFSSFWLYIFGLENYMDDDFESRYSQEFKIDSLGLTGNSKELALRDRFLKLCSKISRLEAFYYIVLGSRFKLNGISLKEEVYSSVRSFFSDFETVLNVDERKKALTFLEQTSSYQRDIVETSSFKAFVEMFNDLVKSRFELRRELYSVLSKGEVKPVEKQPDFHLEDGEAGKQKFINEFVACYDIDSHQVKKLPSDISIFEFLRQMYEYLGCAKEFFEVRDGFVKGVVERLGSNIDSFVLWLLSEEERNICLTSFMILDKVNKHFGIKNGGEIPMFPSWELKIDLGSEAPDDSLESGCLITSDEYFNLFCLASSVWQIELSEDFLKTAFNGQVDWDEWNKMNVGLLQNLLNVKSIFGSKGINFQKTALKYKRSNMDNI